MNQNILNKFPKFNFSVIPTPFQKLENISHILNRSIYCKRDDLTGFALGGNKTRKLDFLIGNAKNIRADTLIAVGSIQSNFCRIASAAGKVAGINVMLILGGKPATPTGNLLLDHIFGATIKFIDSSEWEVWEREAEMLSEKLEKEGKKVYRLPVGGSTPIGALGYVNAFLEIMEQSRLNGINIDTIVHATSSGGTQAGLVVGKTLTGWNGKIIGMAVAKDKPTLVNEVHKLAAATASTFGIKININDVIVDDSYRGPAYAARTKECEEAIKLFAHTEGILLDNVYTGKAAAGLIDYAKREIFQRHENICFIHTGGTVELFE